MKNRALARPLDHPDETTPYRIAGSLRIASLAWIGGAIIYVVGRLDSLDLSPWDSVWVAAMVVGPGVLGVLLSVILESISFPDRNP